ncbi:MAG TPA: hypothetical protein VIT67_18045 [Povalibacter sp.]
MRRIIRVLGCLLGIFIAGSGAFDLVAEPSDFAVDLWLSIPLFASLPSWAGAAVLLSPIHDHLESHRLHLMSAAYTTLLVVLASAAVCALVHEYTASHTRSSSRLLIAAFLIVAANAFVLRCCEQSRRQLPRIDGTDVVRRARLPNDLKSQSAGVVQSDEE